MATTYALPSTIINNSLRQLESRLTDCLDPSHSPFEAALAGLISAGGKRIRPSIALLSGAIFAAPPEPLLNLAASIELLHTATLIHDDLVDGAMFRRGLETLNARWSPSAGVLTGDLAFTKAARLIHSTQSLPAIEMFTRAMELMVEGEVNQLARSQAFTDRDEYFHWIGSKTAVLFELAAAAPALLAFANESAFSAIRRFGYQVGMAFQIIDDVLDFSADPARLGKPTGTDLRQGLLTLPALIYLEEHPFDPDLGIIIRRQSPAAPDLNALARRINQSGAITRAVGIASHFVHEALEDLACLPDCPEHEALAELALSIIERES